MSEVKRYKVINGCLYFGEFGKQEGWSRLSGEAVNASDYDALAADNKRLREALDNAVDVFSDECRTRLQEIEALQQMRAALAGSKEGDL